MRPNASAGVRDPGALRQFGSLGKNAAPNSASLTFNASERVDLFGARQTVVARAFELRRRQNAPALAISPPHAFGGQR
jgi:hypothetical protein